MTKADTTPPDGDLVYVFGVLRSAKEPAVKRAPPGLPGAGRPRLVQAGAPFWLVVADAPAGVYGEDAIDIGLKDLDWVSVRAGAHEEVVEHFMRYGPLVPMKLFTLFASEERARRHIQSMRVRLGRVTEDIAGKDEWGVRVRFDEERAARSLRGPRRGSARKLSSGKDFLLQKKREHDARHDLVADARERTGALFKELRKLASRAREREVQAPAGGTRLLLDAVFLVARTTQARFQAAAKRNAKALAPSGYAISVSGPWPPYHFIGSPR